jgi:hypothetical protein
MDLYLHIERDFVHIYIHPLDLLFAWRVSSIFFYITDSEEPRGGHEYM